MAVSITEELHLDSEIYAKLREAEQEAKLTDTRYSSQEVWQAMQEVIGRNYIERTIPRHTIASFGTASAL